MGKTRAKTSTDFPELFFSVKIAQFSGISRYLLCMKKIFAFWSGLSLLGLLDAIPIPLDACWWNATGSKASLCECNGLNAIIARGWFECAQVYFWRILTFDKPKRAHSNQLDAGVILSPVSFCYVLEIICKLFDQVPTNEKSTFIEGSRIFSDLFFSRNPSSLDFIFEFHGNCLILDLWEK